MNPNDPSTVPGTPGVPEATPTEAGLGVGVPGVVSAEPVADADVGVDTGMGLQDEAAPELTALADAEVPPPAADTPAAPASGNPGTAWNPEAVPAVSAAKAAADFVAQIFAEVAAPEGPAAAEPDAMQDADAQEEALPATPLVSAVEAMAQLLQGQNILILGLGASGMAMARWCVRCGAQVTVADTRATPPQLPALQQEMPQVRFVAGAFDACARDERCHRRYPDITKRVENLLAQADRGIEAAGVDGDQTLVAAARAAGSAQVHLASYAQLAEGDVNVGRDYDLICANFALLHQDIIALLAALKGLLAPGGALVIQTLHPWSVAAGDYQDGWREESFAGFAGDWRPMPWYFRTLASWLTALDMAGLRLISLQEPQHPQSAVPQALLMVAEGR